MRRAVLFGLGGRILSRVVVWLQAEAEAVPTGLGDVRSTSRAWASGRVCSLWYVKLVSWPMVRDIAEQAREHARFTCTYCAHEREETAS